MIADAQQLRDFRVILCWDGKRFGRFNSIEYGFYVYPLMKAGVTLVTVTEGTCDWSDPMHRIVGGVTQEGRNNELQDLAANVSRAHKTCVANGAWVGGIPYGYILIGKKGDKRLVLGDPVKVGIVRRIFREYVEEGRAMINIARRLNAEGYPSPTSRSTRGREGKPGGGGSMLSALSCGTRVTPATTCRGGRLRASTTGESPVRSSRRPSRSG